MKIFLLDLWHDLRQKRLAPVAVLLVVALLAVPIVLAKPAPDEGGSPPSQAAAAAQKKPKSSIVALVEDSTDKSSSLKLFDPRDPFASKEMKSLESLSSSDIVSAAEALSGGDQEQSGGGGESSEGGSEAGSGGGGGSDGGGSTGGTPPATAPDSGGGTQVVKYGYVIDVTFWSNGRARSQTGMKKLEMLPNESSPLLIFLGVESDGSNAVFLIDSSLETEGEGACSPSPSDCGVLSLGAGSVHHFSDHRGNSYTLRVDEIRRKRLSRASASSSRKPSARTAVGSSRSRDEAQPVRRFMPPMLADLVTVASSDGERSSRDEDRR